VVAFNVDPLFNNANGLMYIRIADVPKHDETRYGRISEAEIEKKIKLIPDYVFNIVNNPELSPCWTI
jgi:hypothetical protein